MTDAVIDRRGEGRKTAVVARETTRATVEDEATTVTTKRTTASGGGGIIDMKGVAVAAPAGMARGRKTGNGAAQDHAIGSGAEALRPVGNAATPGVDGITYYDHYYCYYYYMSQHFISRLMRKLQ